jgi:hypothetical protein
MTSIRVVAFVLLFGSLALAQIQMQSTSETALASSAVTPARTTTTETWRIPERLSEAISTNEGFVPLDGSLDKGIAISPSGGDSGENFCFKIRSYVVARDSKDSESTHFVRSSTCQPASKYRVKTTQAEPDVIRP